MNKTKKIAAAVVSVVMAGTMAASFTACGPDNSGPNGPETGSGKDLYNIIDENGNIDYSVYTHRGADGAASDPVKLNIAIGYEKEATSTTFRVADEITLPDGNSYTTGNLKPAWRQMGEDLNIEWNDVWNGSKTSENLNYLVTTSEGSGKKFDSTDMFTSDLSKIVEQSNTYNFLNLAEYLDYMPHFKAFLEQNPVVYLSLLQEGMSTTNGSGQKLYVAPYFDGYNDIERYCIIRQDWAKTLLDGNTPLAENGTTLSDTTHVEAFMGSENYDIESLNSAGNGKITITKDYAEVLKQIKTSGTDLYAAYNAIDSAGYKGNSGNIVDIQNAAIKSGNANGKNLVTLLRAYIDVCYGGHYGETRSDLFNGYDAAWDVDDLVAILRCVVNNEANLSHGANAVVRGITPRAGTNDRTPDLVRLAGQLYGVRGTAAATEYLYVDAAGELHDARDEDEIYDAMLRMHDLYLEGLINNYERNTYKAEGGFGTESTISGKIEECFMMYDYSQTQTLNGFYIEDGLSGAPAQLSGKLDTNDFYFSPIMTPVSRWDVDGKSENGNETIMRFTESWRTVKSSGVGVNGAVKNNQEKLDAVLQFIDYLYSEDGQIVSTFGPMAENANSDGGFWYNTPLANQDETDTAKYFKYKGVKYSGTDYKGKITPTVTANVIKSFEGISVNGWKPQDTSDLTGARLSFTSYARYLIGSTLPVGVKNQSFENQLTSQMGKDGADKVSVALSEKFQTVKGMTLEVSEDSYWYTCVPTSLPVSEDDNRDYIGNVYMDNYKTVFGGSGEKNTYSILNWMIMKGESGSYSQENISFTYTSVQNFLETKLKVETSPTVSQLGKLRLLAYSNAWELAKDYWTYLEANIGK